MRKRSVIFSGCFLLSIMLVLLACGGGGGEGSSSGGVTYTGLTTQAVIDSTNAESIATGAYDGGKIGGSLSLGAIQEEAGGRPNYLDLSLTIEEAIRQIDFYGPPVIVDAGAMVSESKTIMGAGGGSAAYTIQANDQTGDFSGTMSFSGYSSQGTTLTGSASFSGNINVNTLALQRMSLAFYSITVTSGSKSYTANMDMTCIYSGSQAAVTMNIVMRDGTSGKTYKLENFNMTLWQRTGYDEFNLSCRYYEHDYGYVDVSIPTTFKITTGATKPYDGVMVVVGSSNAKAKLTVLSATTFKVEADANGDGTYEWSSGTKSW